MRSSNPCLEALSTVEEYATEHRFKVIQADLTLVVTVGQFESVIAIDLTRGRSSDFLGWVSGGGGFVVRTRRWFFGGLVRGGFGR